MVVKPSEADFLRAVGLCRLLADVARARIVRLLADEGEMHVGAICDRLDMNQSAMSRHLSLLRVAGVVEDRHESRRVFYSVPDPGKLARLITAIFGVREAKPTIRPAAPTP